MSLTRTEKIQYYQALKERLKRQARMSLLSFTKATFPSFEPAGFHKYYYNVLTEFAHGNIKKLMVFMPPQHGKELSDSTLILTPKGFVRHGDLKVGDYVYGREGRPVRVKWVSEKVRSEYNVFFSDGSAIQCHGKHEWVVYDTIYRQERTIETRELYESHLGRRFMIDPMFKFWTDEYGTTIGKQTDKSRRIIRISKAIDPEQGNCIEVEGGIYLAGETLIPTHNSEGSTRRLPAFILGLDPDRRIAMVSYSSPKARKFNREVQRIIDTQEYHEIFPDTCLNGSNITTVAGGWLRNADECEIVDHRGGFKTVGVGGPLTGDPVDTLIMDDIYKDAKSAWSPTVRDSIDDWYDTVAETRLHNDSQQLIVFTRWHPDDLAGRLLRDQGVYSDENPDGWVVVIYQAIKIGGPTEYDNRQDGEPLWPERHNLHKLQLIKERNPHVFESLYQQDPKPLQGLMYEQGFKEYEILPATRRKVRKNYTDTADEGKDYLCSICYIETEIGNFVTDVLYTQKAMEYTEPKMAEMLTKHATQLAVIESNNGGRGFARAVEKLLRLMGNNKTRIKWFHQSLNKNVRIFSHSAEVQNLTFFPRGWDKMWPDFYRAITSYMKVGKNDFDDAPDCITGCCEWRDKEQAQDLAGYF